MRISIRTTLFLALFPGGLLGILTGGAHSALAQTPMSCEAARGEAIIDANNVRAKIMNNGGLFWNGGLPVHQVPRGTDRLTVFKSGVLFSGVVDGEARSAAATSGSWEFWPGPYEEVASGADCAQYDRLYRVERRDLQALAAGGEPSIDVLRWPWQHGAPVVDGDGNPDNYDLVAGDRPLLLGDETIWWVMNDIGNEHGSSNSLPLGLEVQGMAFSSASTDNPYFDTSLFFAYRIINKGPSIIENLSVGVFQDADIGNLEDDFIASDSSLDLAYTYNSDSFDDGDHGYGDKPPANGIQIIGGLSSTGLQGDPAITGSAMSSFIAIQYSGNPFLGFPRSATDFHMYNNGLLRTGRPLTVGGDGTDPDGVPTSYMFFGAAERGEFWSENNLDGNGAVAIRNDRRGISGTGSITLQPGEEATLFFADITAFGNDHLDSIVRLKEAAALFQDLTPDAVPSSAVSGSAPSEAPSMQSVADGATGQPLDLELVWTWPGAKDVEFEVQLTRGSAVDPHSSETRSWLLSEQRLTTGYELRGRFMPGFEPDAAYTVRVRAATPAGYGPWSDPVTFSTGDEIFAGEEIFTGFQVVANAAGPLAEPVGAAADFQGFPGALPRANEDQQVGDGQWMIHTFDNGNRRTFDDFLDRTVFGRANGTRFLVPYDFELRFTAEGGKGWNAFRDRSVVDVPFELWRIGVDTPDDPSDDVRLIPWVIDWDGDGWGITCLDHSVSGGENDPETDAIYWHLPSDESPGDAGYRAWVDELVATGDGGGSAWQAEIMGRMVLVNFNGGDVEDCTFNQDLPEIGTVFRITTGRLPAPIPGAPANEAVVSAGPVSFYWTAASPRASRVEVARDAAFTQLLLVVDDVAPGQAGISALEAGTYWWRVTDALGTVSEPVRFFVGTSVATDDAVSALPERFALGAAYPNPFADQTTITYDVPEAVRVRVTVYDALGRELRTLVDADAAPGRHAATFDAAALPGGMYFYVLEAGAFRDTGTVVVVR